jgi:hypothetical protein
MGVGETRARFPQLRESAGGFGRMERFGKVGAQPQPEGYRGGAEQKGDPPAVSIQRGGRQQHGKKDAHRPSSDEPTDRQPIPKFGSKRGPLVTQLEAEPGWAVTVPPHE